MTLEEMLQEIEQRAQGDGGVRKTLLFIFAAPLSMLVCFQMFAGFLVFLSPLWFGMLVYYCFDKTVTQPQKTYNILAWVLGPLLLLLSAVFMDTKTKLYEEMDFIMWSAVFQFVMGIIIHGVTS